MEITKEWIAQQRAVCEAASPGPWECDETGLYASGEGIAYANTSDEISWSKNDQRFIAFSRTALPAALDALEASMQREVEKDETISNLTVKLAAEKRRANAAESVIYDIEDDMFRDRGLDRIHSTLKAFYESKHNALDGAESAENAQEGSGANG